MIGLDQARKLILDATPVLGRESVPIIGALRRVLAQDIVATEDFPASNISAKDGYAVHHDSLQGASKQRTVRLRIIGESAAGRPCCETVAAGEAVRIMTGGLVPEGADTIVSLEVTAEDRGYVICTNNPKRGRDIRFRGESLKQDDVVFRAGTIISPLEVGALASLKRAYVFVHRKPLVAILTSGDELTDFHEQLSPWKTMSSNLYSLAALVVESGAVSLCLGIVKDDLNALQSLLSDALQADVIITSGGMSMGRYDLIQETFASLGMDMNSSTILGKPGKPSIFGKIGGSLVFGLPGNPTAAMISFEQFIKPALLKMSGYPSEPHASRSSHGCGGIGSFPLNDKFDYDGHRGNEGLERASLIPLKMPLQTKSGDSPKQTTLAGPPPGLSEIIAS